MRTTIANLKHLYQCRAFWLFYLLLALFTRELVDRLETGSPFAWFDFLMINAFAGLGVGLLQQEVFSCPFVRCLPGHGPMPRRLIVGFGMVLNLLLSLVIFVRKDLASHDVPVIMAAAFSMGLTGYLLPASFVFTIRDRIAYGFVFISVTPMILAAKYVDYLILRSPAAFVTLGTVTTVGAWAYLGTDWLARRHVGQAVRHFSGLSKGARRRKESTAYTLSGPLSRWVQMFFYARIETRGGLSAARCIWGDLYVACAMLLSSWITLLLTCLPTVFFLAFAAARLRPSGTDELAIKVARTFSVILFVPAIVVSFIPTFLIPTWVFSNMLLTRGRRERFAAMISTAIAMSLFLSLSLMLIAASTVLLQYLAPGTFGNLTRLFGGLVTAAFVAVPWALVPLGLAVRLIAKYLDVTIAYVFVFCVLVLIATADHWFAWIGVPLLVAASACCWLALILATHRICTRVSFTE
ncbi:MAG: hypothetical protein JW955_21015 [Sedimentisphaerales bacterium]|nr:hypothetical protein [Sedimentisphaerales bacterium]